MSKRQQFVNKAISFLGCNEADGSFKKIIDIYNSITPLPVGYKMKTTDEWCAAFVSAVAKACNMTDIVFPECGCERMIKLYQAAGRWQENDAYSPLPGDILFYDWADNGLGDNTGFSDHVAIVVAVNGKTLKVIEGNKSQKVDYRSIQINAKYIRGYGLPDFGEEVKVKESYKGVDLSGWQNDFTDGSVLTKGGIDFAILKVTEGTSYTNHAFTAHYNMCQKHNIPMGAYVYSHAVGAAGGKAEGEFAVKTLAGRKLTLPVYLDIEDDYMLSTGKSSIMAAVRAFGAVLKAAGYKVGVYASLSRFGTYIDAEALRKEGYSIWCAAYNNKGAGMDCDIWQHTDKGKLSGYSGNLDFNVMYNTALLTGVTASEPQKTVQTVKQVQPKLYQLTAGSEGSQVKTMQILLIEKHGISCGVDGADGDFGPNTEKAVIQFQRRKGLAADGICGIDTWTALLAG